MNIKTIKELDQLTIIDLIKLKGELWTYKDNVCVVLEYKRAVALNKKNMRE